MKNFGAKVLLNEAFTLGVINRMEGQYFTHEGDPICEKGKTSHEENAAAYLVSPIGQEERLKLQARIKNAKEQ